MSSLSERATQYRTRQPTLQREYQNIQQRWHNLSGRYNSRSNGACRNLYVTGALERFKCAAILQHQSVVSDKISIGVASTLGTGQQERSSGGDETCPVSRRHYADLLAAEQGLMEWNSRGDYAGSDPVEIERLLHDALVAVREAEDWFETMSSGYQGPQHFLSDATVAEAWEYVCEIAREGGDFAQAVKNLDIRDTFEYYQPGRSTPPPGGLRAWFAVDIPVSSTRTFVPRVWPSASSQHRDSPYTSGRQNPPPGTNAYSSRPGGNSSDRQGFPRPTASASGYRPPPFFGGSGGYTQFHSTDYTSARSSYNSRYSSTFNQSVPPMSSNPSQRTSYRRDSFAAEPEYQAKAPPKTFGEYNAAWRNLTAWDNELPFPSITLEAEALQDKSTLGLGLFVALNWRIEDVMRYNTGLFLMSGFNIQPGTFNVSPGKAQIGTNTPLDRVEAMRKHLRGVEILRWHSDRLAQRTGAPGGGIDAALAARPEVKAVWLAVDDLHQQCNERLGRGPGERKQEI